jgi:hypothetical protein
MVEETKPSRTYRFSQSPSSRSTATNTQRVYRQAKSTRQRQIEVRSTIEVPTRSRRLTVNKDWHRTSINRCHRATIISIEQASHPASNKSHSANEAATRSKCFTANTLRQRTFNFDRYHVIEPKRSPPTKNDQQPRCEPRPRERIAIYPNCSEAERRDRLCVELCGFACVALDSIQIATYCGNYRLARPLQPSTTGLAAAFDCCSVAGEEIFVATSG